VVRNGRWVKIKDKRQKIKEKRQKEKALY